MLLHIESSKRGKIVDNVTLVFIPTDCFNIEIEEVYDDALTGEEENLMEKWSETRPQSYNTSTRKNVVLRQTTHSKMMEQQENSCTLKASINYCLLITIIKQ